jgi:hypothetical protein
MTPRERVWAALRGEAVDRPPISFWGHFYHRESSARDLALQRSSSRTATAGTGSS